MGNTPLHLAARDDRVAIIHTILSVSTVNPNVQDQVRTVRFRYFSMLIILTYLLTCSTIKLLLHIHVYLLIHL